MTSHVVGSIVRSITSVKILPPSVVPTIHRRFSDGSARGFRTVTCWLRGSCRLIGGDAACAELVKGGFSRQEFVDDVGHRRSTLTVRQADLQGLGTRRELVPKSTPIDPDLA
jgi:hypothetical protein